MSGHHSTGILDTGAPAAIHAERPFWQRRLDDLSRQIDRALAEPSRSDLELGGSEIAILWGRQAA